MNKVYEDTDKVLASNEGDEFHIVWTARRCLQLLNPKNDLKAVVVEGVSPKDKATRGGVLKADTTEYYGSDSYEDATRFVMSQLKYAATTGQKDKAWAAGELEETIAAFAEDFDGKCNEYGEVFVKQKTHYVFVTNRPISNNVLSALNINYRSCDASQHTKNARERIKKACKLDNSRFELFLKALIFQAREKNRPAQEWEYLKELRGYLPGEDSLLSFKLEKLVRDNTLLDGDRKPIDQLRLLLALGVPSVKDLMPTPPAEDFILPKNYVSRSQEAEIAKLIIDADDPVLIHASGGVGKSSLALKLHDLMPKGSKSMIFDGYADGLYRQPSIPRHKHHMGLVHIANDLASQQLCDPLLPTASARKEKFLEAFIYRLEQSTAALRRDNEDALLLIVLDAADNSEQAAMSEPSEPCSFGKDLLKESIPPNCRLVVTARTERYQELLEPPSNINIFELKPFTLKETSKHLKSFYPDVDDSSVREFYRMTCQNPRVQFNALYASQTFNDMMQSMGKLPLGVDEAISKQLNRSLEDIKQQQTSPAQIDSLCTALALLPPLVPISILAKASEIEEATVYSFIADFGHYIMERDGAVHFRDEPVDTWFQENFSAPSSYDNIINALRIMGNSSYACLALPKLLWQAGKNDELMKLAIGDDGLPDDNIIERRRIVLLRVQFALKAAIQKNNYADIAKLSLRAGEEIAGNEREYSLLIKNHDLIYHLLGFERTQEIVFRHHGGKFNDVNFVFAAAILANDSASLGEAKYMLRKANDWLVNWSKMNDEERKKYNIDDDYIASFQMAHLHIHGAKIMVHELSRWQPDDTIFTVSLNLIKRLVDIGEFDVIFEIARESEENPFIILAIASELSKVGKFLSKKISHDAIKHLLRKARHHPKQNMVSEAHAFPEAIISLVESGAHNGVPTRTLIRLLNLYMPDIPSYGIDDYHYQSRSIIMRFYCLKAILQGSGITISDFATPELKKKLAAKNAEHLSGVRRFNEVVGVLLPWYELRSKVVCRLTAKEVPKYISEIMKLTSGKWSYYRSDATYVANEMVIVWLDVLLKSRSRTDDSFEEILTWMKNKDAFFYYPTRIAMARSIARSECPDIAYDLLSTVYKDFLEDRENVEGRLETVTSISRAILSLDKGEPAEYFEKALSIVNNFGDEVYHQWEVITNLAKYAGNCKKPNAALAYNFMTAAEVIHDFNDHKFPWHSVIEKAAKLCPYSSFPLLSRLLSRDKVFVEDMLPSLASFLHNENLLTVEAYAALTSFQGHWSECEIAESALEADVKKGSLVLDQFIEKSYILNKKDNLDGFAKLSKDYAVENERLAKDASLNKIKKEIATNKTFERNKDDDPDPDIDWERVIGTGDYTEFSIIDAASDRLSAYLPYSPNHELYKQMRQTIPSGKEAAFINGLAQSQSMDIYSIIHALEDCKEEWGGRLSIQQALKKAVVAVIHNKTHECIDNYYAIGKRLKTLALLSGQNVQEIFPALLNAVSQSLEDINSQGFFSLTYKASEFLSYEEAVEVFEYSLSRLDNEINENDGDGLWKEKLVPPDCIDEALAGFLYFMLSHPKAELRWQAAHTVLWLCRYEQSDVVSQLIKRIETPEMDAFASDKFPFYAWNSKLYLIIAIARAAKEKEEFLLAHKDVFLKMALGEPKHVLIRHFAAETLLSIKEVASGVLKPEEIEQLKNINQTRLPVTKLESDVYNAEVFNHGRLKSSYGMPMDFDNDWLARLCSIFGANNDEAAKQIFEWSREEADEYCEDNWFKDPRRDSAHYKYNDNTCRHGEHPEVDSLAFYLSYHNLLRLAAEYIDTKPLLIQDAWQERWNEWLNCKLLSRKDGYWLYDRRDPHPPISEVVDSLTPYESMFQNWEWDILQQNFDSILLPNDKNKINLFGKMNITQGWLREDIAIRSAVISEYASDALLRALQTEDSSNEYYIPNCGHHMELNQPNFKMHGWVSEPESGLNFDKYDKMSGRIYWPHTMPSKRTLKFLNLKISEDFRSWKHKGNDVLRCMNWGDHESSRHKQAGNYGQLLEADISFTLSSLKKIKSDLIIEVKIERKNDGRDTKEDDYISYENRNYTRIYLLKQSGQLCTLYGSTRIGKEDCSGIK